MKRSTPETAYREDGQWHSQLPQCHVYYGDLFEMGHSTAELVGSTISRAPSAGRKWPQIVAPLKRTMPSGMRLLR